MFIVTGGFGFIGSNLIKTLNKNFDDPVLVVDDLSEGIKFSNLSDLNIYDYIDKTDFINSLKNSSKFNQKVKAVFHLGACSDTTEWDGRYLMKNNYEYSKDLLHWCIDNKIQLIYASSASVYGYAQNGFVESIENEKPINMYAYSKFLFDQYSRKYIKDKSTQIVGLRYFNVYGPRESHKGKMASTFLHFHNQINEMNYCNLFEGSHGYGDGEQKRDFVYVDDCVNVNLWFLANPNKSGIFNVGSGVASSFNDVANSVIKWHKYNYKTNPEIKYIEFPENLIESYQSYTKADLTALRAAGYSEQFLSVEEGATKYLDCINHIN